MGYHPMLLCCTNYVVSYYVVPINQVEMVHSECEKQLGVSFCVVSKLPFNVSFIVCPKDLSGLDLSCPHPQPKHYGQGLWEDYD